MGLVNILSGILLPPKLLFISGGTDTHFNAYWLFMPKAIITAVFAELVIFFFISLIPSTSVHWNSFIAKTFPSPFIYLYNFIFTVHTHGCSLFILWPRSKWTDLTIGSPLRMCPLLVNILNWKSLLYSPQILLLKYLIIWKVNQSVIGWDKWLGQKISCEQDFHDDKKERISKYSELWAFYVSKGWLPKT